MKSSIYVGASIDGYIADKNENLDFLTDVENPEGSDLGFYDFMNSIDALIMGRKTFKFVLAHADEWPYSKPVYVLSKTIRYIPKQLHNKAFLVDSDIDTLLNKLEKEGLSNLYIDGGQVIQEFMQKDLIDEMIITTVPTILGDGISLFNTLDKSLKFELVKSEVLLEQLVKTHYKRASTHF